MTIFYYVQFELQFPREECRRLIWGPYEEEEANDLIQKALATGDWKFNRFEEFIRPLQQSRVNVHFYLRSNVPDLSKLTFTESDTNVEKTARTQNP